MRKIYYYKIFHLLSVTGIFFLGFISPSIAQDVTTIHGQIIEARTKSPLAGASIGIKGTTNDVLSENNGNFKLVTAKKIPFTIIVSFVGYETQEVAVINTENLSVQLAESASKLNEVVVVGYGSQKRSQLTGSVASIPKAVLNQPAVSFDNFLQGSVAGVAVTQNSSQPGATATIRVRGGNSLLFGNDPLYVIDGFITYNNNNYINTGAATGPSVNALSTINPSDIESIEVLKDAAATAIYGSRGANGVVLITTRRGKKGSSTVNYNVYAGTQRISRKLELLNGGEWASLVNDISTSTGGAKLWTDAQIDSIGAGSDWQDAALKNGSIQNHDLSITGGDEKSRYLISGNYFTQDGTILKTGFKRYSARINYERNVSEKLKVNLNVFGSRSSEDKLFGAAYNSINFSGAFPSLILTSPVAAIYNGDGSYNVNSAYFTTPTNPLQDITSTINHTNLNRLIGNFSAEYKLLKDLTFKITAGGNLLSTKQNFYGPSYASTGYANGGLASVGTSDVSGWLNENTLTYEHTFDNKHFLNVLVGYTVQSEKVEYAVASSQKFPNDLTTYNNLSFASVAANTSDESYRGLRSWLGRVNYSFAKKYNFTFSGRADASSALGANKKWGFFPAAGFSWNISEESFYTPLANTVKNLKLRLSAGITGNAEVPPYSSLRKLTAVNYYFGGPAPALVTGIAPTSLANPNLQWEPTTQYNAGIDAGLFNNRINVTVDAYYKKTNDLLINLPLPIYTGYTSALVNVGSIENKGFEIAINSDNIKTKDFLWRSVLVFAKNNNKVTDIGEIPYFFPTAPTGQVSPVIVKEGLPVGTFWGYTTNGLLTADDISKGAPFLTGVSQQVGDRKYVDINGDGKVTTDDKHDLGSSQPKFTYGFSNNLSYKNFDLAFFFQGSQGNKIFNLLKQSLERTTLSTNAPKELVNRWSATNPNGTLPKATNAPVAQVTDRYIEDASYLKLKNVSLGYSFSKGVLSKLHAKQLRLYVSAQNLFTVTKYTGLDPEANFYDQDNLRQGVDYGAYPASRTFIVGANISF
ncbi:MAG: TonB-dependent receptor [Ferruginibacter sp.]